MDVHEIKWLSINRNECVKVGYVYPECGYYQIKSRNFSLRAQKTRRLFHKVKEASEENYHSKKYNISAIIRTV